MLEYVMKTFSCLTCYFVFLYVKAKEDFDNFDAVTINTGWTTGRRNLNEKT